MNLKLVQLKKLSKREKNLAIAVGFSLFTAIYWYGFLKPNITHVKELTTQEQTFKTQLEELNANANKKSIYQQADALKAQKLDLTTKIAELQKSTFITEKSFISTEIAKLGDINKFELNEVSRNKDAIKYNLNIEHTTDYNKFISSIKDIENKYPQLLFTMAGMVNKTYKSEWTVWVKQ